MLDIRTISDRLVDVVRDRILSGEIQPDVAIGQDKLAIALRVSKIPLREALARLEQDGLLVSHPNRGFFVRPLSTPEAEEVFALRLKIEPDAAAFACLAATDEERAEARAALDRLAAAGAASLPTVGSLNRAFHLALVRPGEQHVTTNVVKSLHFIADRYVRKHLEPQNRHLRAAAEHQHILDAWLQGDSARVRKELYAHIEQTLNDLRDQIGSGDRSDSRTGSKAPKRKARRKSS